MENLTTKLKKVAKNQSILIVDDDAITLETIKSLIGFFYKKVDTAINGEKALELYKTNSYDIVLTDIIMPIMDGVELSRKIREINEKQIIVIASAHSESEHLLDLMNIGVDKFLKKPIDSNLINCLYKESEKIENTKLVSKYRRDFKDEIAKRRTSILCAIKSIEFKEFLEKQDYDTDFVNIKEIYKFVEFEEPNLILLDDRAPNVKFVINDLRSCDLTRHIPIAILSTKENKAHNKQLLVLGIEEIIPYELSNEEILKVITRIIDRERYSNSYSGRFIRGLQSYEETAIHGIKLRSIAKVICREYHLDMSETMDVKSVLSLLSTTLEEKRVSKLAAFFKKMRFSRKIRDHLENLETPTDLTGEIIKAVYYVYKAKCKHKECTIKGVRDEIRDLAYKCMVENTVIIQRPTDLDFLYITITDLLNDNKEVDLFTGHDLINIVSSISHNYLLDKQNILIHTVITSTNHIEITIEAEEHTEAEKYLEDVKIPKNLKYTTDKNIFTINTQTKQEIAGEELAIEPEFIDIDSTTETKVEEKEKMSAAEFIAYLDNEDIDLDILDELAELEEDLDGIASREIVTMDIVESVSNIVIRYARFIESIMEFHEISSSLYSLSTILGRVKEEDLTLLDRSLLAFFDGILYDIRNWREGIFVYKTVVDIHFLDASFISNCSQIEMFLAPPEAKEDLSSDDILFF